MIEYIVLLINTILVSLFHSYCWNKLSLNGHRKIFNSNYFILVFFLTLALYITNCLFIQPFRLIIIFVLLVTINYFLVSKELKKAIISTVFSLVILALAETSFVILTSLLIGNKIDTIIYRPIPSILLNCYILIISCLISRSKLIYKVYLMFLENKFCYSIMV